MKEKYNNKEPYYNYLNRLLGEETILSGSNDNKENVIIQRVSKDCILVITSQDNGWLRKNYYYEDGTKEETFEK